MRHLIIIFLLAGLFSCGRKANNNTDNITDNFNGIYCFVSDSGRKALRGWGREYWEIEIKGNKGHLAFYDSRGLYSFRMSALLEYPGKNVINMKFDSIEYRAYIPIAAIDSFKKNDLIMKLECINKRLLTHSKITNASPSGKSVAELAIFEKTDSKNNIK